MARRRARPCGGDALPTAHLDDILERLVVTLGAGDIPPDELFDAICAALVEAGCTAAAVYVVDYDQLTLQPIAGAPAGSVREPQPVAGSPAGRAFLGREPRTVELPDGRRRIWAGVREQADRMGVVEMEVRDDPASRRLADRAAAIGLLAGQYLHSVARYTDRFELLRRRQPMHLAAEMQWSMLVPALSMDTPRLSVAATFEPAYNIGGDAFDYAVRDHRLHLCVLDAMGHGVGATLASALAVGAYRFGRRQAMELPELARTIDGALAGEWDGDRFVTGHLAHLDADTGELAVLNAGHPPPLLIRRGRAVGEVLCPPGRPFGLGGQSPQASRIRLRPDDCVLFYTDGAVEARRGRDQLGLDRFVALLEQELDGRGANLQVLRRLVDHVVAHSDATPLADDLTLILFQWHPRAAVG